MDSYGIGRVYALSVALEDMITKADLEPERLDLAIYLAQILEDEAEENYRKALRGEK